LQIPIVNFFIEPSLGLPDTTSQIKDYTPTTTPNSKMNSSNGDCEKELDKALAIIQQMELRIKDKDETILFLKERNK
jgi:hypothetical protein